MQSFFEFYELLKNKKLNENAMMPQQGMQPPAPNMGMGGGMNSPATAAPGSNQPGVLGQDMDLDMTGDMSMNLDAGADESGMSKASQKQTSAPEGGVSSAADIYTSLDAALEFIKNMEPADGGDPEQNDKLKAEVEDTINALKKNLETLTGEPAPASEGAEDETSDEMGAPQPPENGTGIEDASSAEMNAGSAPGGAPAGGNLFPSQGGGAGDMGGMGGSSPMGMPGAGGGSFGM